MAPGSPKKATLDIVNTTRPLATTHPAMNFPPRPLGSPVQATFYYHGYRGPNPPFTPPIAPYVGQCL